MTLGTTLSDDTHVSNALPLRPKKGRGISLMIVLESCYTDFIFYSAHYLAFLLNIA